MNDQGKGLDGARAGEPVKRRVSRGLALALFLLSLLWVWVASGIAQRAAQGIAVRFGWQMVEDLLLSLFLLFLVVVGFRVLESLSGRAVPAEDVLRLPRRTGWWREWGLGAAVGWALCLFAVLPALLSRNLHSSLHRDGIDLLAIGVTLGTLLVATLAEEVIFRAYPLQRLSQAVGPTFAAIVLSLAFGVVLVSINPPRHPLLAIMDGTLFGLVLTMAYMRTHALWVGWGLHFSYRAVAAVLFGLPIAGHGVFPSFLESYATGPRWLSGGAFGLDAALLTGFVMLVGMIVLSRVTREYAWAYTHPAIVPGGYEVTIAPPAAHVAMERTAAAAPPPLVQIAASTPGGFSAEGTAQSLRDDRS